MRKLIVILAVALLLAGCSDDPDVRPMIGTYKLSDKTAIIAYKSDDTFIYSELVGGEEWCTLTGTYNVELDQYNFKTARGTLVMRASSDESYEGMLLGGTVMCGFYWYTRNESPVLTWIYSETDSSQNYTFYYCGTESALDYLLEEDE